MCTLQKVETVTLVSSLEAILEENCGEWGMSVLENGGYSNSDIFGRSKR